MRATTIKKWKKDSGYTLIELAIVIMIVGVIMGAFFSVYNVYLENKKIIQTETSLSRLTAAIGNFRAQYGRYPCPASLTAPRTSAHYGREAADLCLDETQVTIGTCDLNPADPMKGYCVERSARQIDTDGDLAPDTYPRVRRGSIPFRNLNVAEEFSYDGYGNRINYAVTERLAVANTFEVDGGGINIIDDEVPPQPLLFTSNSGHFLIISPGENNAGAYNSNGVLVQACPNPATAEGKNCDTEPTKSEYVQTGLRMTNNNTRFDDRLSFYSQVELSLWKRAGTVLPDRNNIQQRPTGFVDINTDSPSDNIADVDGAIHAEDKILAKDLCNLVGSTSAGNCFAAGLIGGAGMDCSTVPGNYMIGISEGAPKCTDSAIVSCPSGQLLAGVNPDGSLVCRAKGCAAQTYTFCGGLSDALPSGVDGDTTIGPTSGVTFTCNTPNWVPASTPAACCVPGTSTTNASCPSGYTGGPSIVTTVTTCSPPSTTTTANNSACVCTGGAVTQNLGCPPGYSGTRIQHGTLQCPGGGTTWGMINDTCIPPPSAVCSWQPVNQTGVVTTSSMPSPAAGSSCKCGKKNKSCFTVGIPGISYNKHNCRCSVN